MVEMKLKSRFSRQLLIALVSFASIASVIWYWKHDGVEGSAVGSDAANPISLKMKCYTFNGKVSCSQESIMKERAKGNAVVKVADNLALKHPQIIGPEVQMVPFERIKNLQTEINRDSKKLKGIQNDKAWAGLEAGNKMLAKIIAQKVCLICWILGIMRFVASSGPALEI
mmetsp:Transcript_78240/g.210561  ORF Transcript_78240/g.210561 Transcript_78240/m.210561 type:complete len:170 (-) Transcript_78240:87-596(-)